MTSKQEFLDSCLDVIPVVEDGDQPQRSRKSLLDERKQWSRKIHEDDAPPAHEQERPAEFLLSRMQSPVMGLILEGVASDILETAVFYNWIRLTSIS